MKIVDVEESCSYLSTLFKRSLQQQILKITEPREEYFFDEVLCFWVADLLTSTNLLAQEQLRLVLDTFIERLRDFGRVIGSYIERDATGNTTLPVCRLAIADRKYVCIDGENVFIDLSTGVTITQLETSPLETVTFNLTTLVVRKYNKFRSVKRK